MRVIFVIFGALGVLLAHGAQPTDGDCAFLDAIAVKDCCQSDTPDDPTSHPGPGEDEHPPIEDRCADCSWCAVASSSPIAIDAVPDTRMQAIRKTFRRSADEKLTWDVALIPISPPPRV